MSDGTLSDITLEIPKSFQQGGMATKLLKDQQSERNQDNPSDEECKGESIGETEEEEQLTKKDGRTAGVGGSKVTRKRSLSTFEKLEEAKKTIMENNTHFMSPLFGSRRPSYNPSEQETLPKKKSRQSTFNKPTLTFTAKTSEKNLLQYFQINPENSNWKQKYRDPLPKTKKKNLQEFAENKNLQIGRKKKMEESPQKKDGGIVEGNIEKGGDGKKKYGHEERENQTLGSNKDEISENNERGKMGARYRMRSFTPTSIENISCTFENISIDSITCPFVEFQNHENTYIVGRDNQGEIEYLFDRIGQKFFKLVTCTKIPQIDILFYRNTFFRHPSSVGLYNIQIIISNLKDHKRKTIQVMKAIKAREKVMKKLRKLASKYDPEKILDIQTKGMQLLQQLQMTSLTVVEEICKWRSTLTRPYAFNYKCHNYLMKMKKDAEFLDTCAIASIFPVKLSPSPLLSNFASFGSISITSALLSTQQAVTYPLTKSKMNKEQVQPMNAALSKRLKTAEDCILEEERMQQRLILHLQNIMNKGYFIPVLQHPNIPDCSTGIALST